MSDMSASASAHLAKVIELQAFLADMHGAAVLEHNYTLLLMGSFRLVVGTANSRLKFDWDGREFYLNIKGCTCQSLAAPQEWQQLHNSRIAPPASAWPIIHQHCGQAFGA